jgi:hypothetical protein
MHAGSVGKYKKGYAREDWNPKGFSPERYTPRTDKLRANER